MSRPVRGVDALLRSAPGFVPCDGTLGVHQRLFVSICAQRKVSQCSPEEESLQESHSLPGAAKGALYYGVLRCRAQTPPQGSACPCSIRESSLLQPGHRHGAVHSVGLGMGAECCALGSPCRRVPMNCLCHIPTQQLRGEGLQSCASPGPCRPPPAPDTHCCRVLRWQCEMCCRVQKGLAQYRAPRC